jgi:ferredoxin-thioredoxin reductase catalytic subunit
MTSKRFWRCNVCNDIHHGIAGPETCPTCMQKNAYCEIDEKEINNLLETGKQVDTSLTEEDLKRVWKAFTEKNDFKLNPDQKHVDMIAKGVLKNQDKFGLKLCPCRMRENTRENDLELICPCNFKTHNTWKDENKRHCWCGLFVKK